MSGLMEVRLCWVYAAQIEGCGPVKFGATSDPDARLRSLQAWTPHEITLLVKVKAPHLAEKWLHNALRFWRIRGEWYAPTDEVLSALNYMRAHGRLPMDLCVAAFAQIGDRLDIKSLQRWQHQSCPVRSAGLKASWARKRARDAADRVPNLPMYAPKHQAAD